VQAQTDPEARRLLHVYTRRLESNLLHALRELASRERAAASPRSPRRSSTACGSGDRWPPNRRTRRRHPLLETTIDNSLRSSDQVFDAHDEAD
jgi:hypothetical protein